MRGALVLTNRFEKRRYKLALALASTLFGLLLAELATRAFFYVRYLNADTRDFEEINQTLDVEDIIPDIDDASASFRLHAACAELSELLRGSVWADDGSYVDLRDFAAPLVGEIDLPEVAEFLDLIRLAGRYVDVN